MTENTTKSIIACQKAAHGGLSLSNNPFGEVWRTRRSSKVNSYRPAFPGRSIFTEGATRTLCSFRSPPSGRFATFGGKCPGCSIIRTFLTVVLMVSLPRYGSLCHLRWQQPTGLALPSAPQGWRFPPRHRAHASLRPLRMKSEPSDMGGGFGSLA